MVAIVAGNGLGLFNTSFNTLGGAGTFGQGGGLGQAGGGAFVNAATGNLILQFNDEQLSGLGQDLYHLRTYNTQGVIGDDDADGWRWQGERKLVLSGTVNTAGSTVTRTTGDGHQTVYAWNGSGYASSEGDGAHDSLVWSAGTSEWVWTDGSARTVERYLGATGRLASVTDANGTSIIYSYDANGRLSSVKDSSGQELVLNYNAAGKLERLDTRTASGGALTRQVYYTYDASGRLTSVSTDLTPSDNSIVDGKVYTTTYTYDGTSFRIAGISQSDGTSVGYTYVLVGSEYRVASVTDASGTSTFTYDTVNRRTDVSNGLGQQWSYFYDAANQLTQVQTPAVDGQRLSTSYAYDANGNVTSITDGRGNVVIYQYDANGNRTLERDALGNTVTRVYSSASQLLNESRYTTPATYDSATSIWTNPATATAQTTRYAYDSSNRLRYVISAAGTVTEYRYDVSGLRTQEVTYTDTAYSVSGLAPTTTLSEATLNTWAAARDKTKSQLTELTYDYRGNLSKTTIYATVDSAGVGTLNAAAQVTEYVYSEYGQLLQTIAVRGAARTTKTTLSAVVYDGQGRILSQVDASGTQTYVYTGGSRQVAVTNTAGLTTTQTFDTRGRLVSISAAGADGYGATTTRTTQYIYDANGRLAMTQDATGVRSYTFYDEAGRVSARVDGVGAVTEYIYSATGQLTQEKRYATLAVTTSWYNGTAVTKTLVSQIRPAANATDRVTTYGYDNADRLATRTDAAGTVTAYSYDGRNQLIQTQTLDRTTRYFYNAAGRQTGQLDAEGYLRESVYNAAGQLVQVIRYSVLTNATYQASGTLAQLRPTVTGALSTWYFYDDAGRQIGSVDEQQFVTETVFDEALNTQQSIRYATAYTTAITTSTAFDTIKTAVAGGAKQTTTTAFDSYGRVSQRTGNDGTITGYEYDTAGCLVKETHAQGTAEERSLRTRYDAFGQTIGRLLGEASTRITGGMTDTQIAAVYADYGLTYKYDVAGRAASVTDANGNKTVSYYDEAGRLTHVVNALGEVSETVYSAFGEASEQTRLSARLSNPGSLTGGLNTPIKSLVAGIKSATDDNKTTYGYNVLGLLTAQTDAMGWLTSSVYSSYGERTSLTRTIAAGVTATQNFTYSKRGELLSRIEDVGGLNRTTSTTYDAFGRIKTQVDGRGLTTTTSYDLNGRKITVSNPLSQTQSTEYDAWGRTFKTTDALGKVTTFSYDDAARKLTVAYPDGASVVTERNRHGETFKVTDGRGNTTTYSYTKDGQLDTVVNALTQTTTDNTYDDAGNLISSKDALNNTTGYGYDAANRVLTRTDALGTVTRYAFDGQGRQITVTEAEGTPEQRITAYAYDRKGQVLTITQDPSGLALRTTYAYDGLGQQVQVSQGTIVSPSQQVTLYTFDKLGRRISERLDPNGLNITTQYKYNGNDQVTRKIDALGNSTWFVYDNAGRLTDTIDTLGAVTRDTYDANGRVTTTTRYATALAQATVAAFGDSVASVSPTVSAAQDRVTGFVYDDMGRLRFSINSLNQVVETRYDAAGQIKESRSYDKAIAAGTPRDVTSITAALTTAGAQAITTVHDYDAANRLTKVTDALGSFEEYTYDAAGNRKTLKNKAGAVWTYNYDALNRVTEEISPAVTVSAVSGSRYIVSTTSYDALGNVVSRSEGRLRTNLTDAASADNLTQARSTSYVYDKAGRLSSTTDAAGKSESYTYDALGNRKTLTNKAGNVWVYNYDVLSRLVEEVTPVVSVQATADGAAVDRKLVTQIGYDVLGNVISRTEGVLRDPAGVLADDVSQARTTLYAFDALGHQIRTTQPGWYNKTTGRYQQTSDGTSNTFQVTTEVTYDALGNAVRNRIKVNSTGVAATDYVDSYQVYDLVGRVRYDIDALSGVTESGYDALGQVTSVKRYANALTSGVPAGSTFYVFGDMASRLSADAVNDRTLTTTYDAVGRKTAVQQNLINTYTYAGGVIQVAPTTIYTYNALGQVVRETLVGRAANGTTVITGPSTVSYYDVLGRCVGSVDALGYYTRSEYDAQGQMSRQVEYNTALTSWTEGVLPTAPATNANDRSTAYEYDSLGRVTKVTQEGVRYYIQTGTATTGGNLGASLVTGNLVVSQSTYDNLGNVKTQTDALGNVTTTDYDVLGRTIKVTEPVRTAARAGVTDPFSMALVTASPVTTMALNAFGQVVKQTRTAGAAGGYSQAGLTQISKSAYDAAGNEIQSVDAGGGTVNYKVDAQGRRIEESQLASATWSELNDLNDNGYADDTAVQKGYSHTIRRTFDYDKLGQQLATYDWYLDAASQSQRTKTSQVFNRFGEAAEQYLNDKLISSVTYDQAGRRTQQVGAQGVVNTDYDIAGKETRVTQAGDTAITTDDRVTIMSYDLLGRVLTQRLPHFMANTQANTLLLPVGAVDFDPNPSLWLTDTTPIITLTYDRWGNTTSQTDARGKVTAYTYDHANRGLTETLPETDILRENGTSYRASLIHERRYDALGRLIQEVDLIGPYAGVSTATELRKRQHVYNAVGQLVADVDAIFTQTNGADGNVRSYALDMNGRRVGTKDVLGTVLVDSYDAMGRQLTHGIIRSGVQTVLQTNQYDQAGRLYAEISGTTAVEETLRSVAATVSPWDTVTTGVAGNTVYTVFDERGNIVRTRNESKVEKFYEFDVNNRKVVERDGLNNTLTWQYRSDVGYERLASRKDLGGLVYNFAYNNFGQVNTESLVVSGSDVTRNYEYYDNGQVKRISDVKITLGATSTIDYRYYDERDSVYQYDVSGNKVRALDGSLNFKENTYKSDGHITYSFNQDETTETRYAFDEQGRLKGVYVPNNGNVLTGAPSASLQYVAYEGARVDELTYRYDEFGNRRQVFLNTVTEGGTRTQIDYRYAYDANDQVRVAEGYVNASGKIVAGQVNGKAKGYAISYGRTGLRATSEQWTWAFYDGWSGAIAGNKFREELYEYNDLGQVTAIRGRATTRLGDDTSQARLDISYDSDGYGTMVTEYAEGAQFDLLLNTYDGRGNKMSDVENDKDGKKKTRSDYSYRGDGQMDRQTTYKYSNAREVYDKLQVTYFNEVGMYDAAARQTNYRYVVFKTSSSGVTSYNYRGNYVKTYLGFDAYKDATTVATWINKSGTAGTSTLTYDDRGGLQQVKLTGGTAYTRRFALNREGQIILRHQVSKETSDNYIYYNGASLAHLGVPNKPELMDTFTPISSSYPASTPSSYVVNDGDTLEGIAQMVWGDAQMWYLIADANGLEPTDTLVVGDTLTIPNVVTSTHNDSKTFKPYNPAEAIGNTTPSPKPPEPKCNAVAAVVMIVVAVVAAFFTGGAALAALGQIGAGIVGGMVGSAMSQLAGMAMGVVDSFSWSQVAISGIVGGIAAGVGEALAGTATGSSAVNGASKFAEVVKGGVKLTALGQAVQGASTVAANYVANKALGQKTSFSWAAVAAGFVAGYAQGALGMGQVINTTATAPTFSFSAMMKGLSENPGELVQGSARAMFGNVLTSSTKRLFGAAGKQNWGELAVDAFGNALGSYVANSMTAKSNAPEQVKTQSSITERPADLVSAAMCGADYGLPDVVTADQALDSEVTNAFRELSGAKGQEKRLGFSSMVEGIDSEPVSAQDGKVGDESYWAPDEYSGKTNKTYKDSAGRVRNAENHRYANSALSKKSLAKTWSPYGFDKSISISGSGELESGSWGGRDYISPILDSDNIFVGVRSAIDTYFGWEQTTPILPQKNLELTLVGGARAELILAEANKKIGGWSVDAEVTSGGVLRASMAINGKDSYGAAVQASGAVALIKAKAAISSSKYELGLIYVKADAELEGHLIGAGGALGAGFQSYKSRPGGVAFGEIGVTPFFAGARVQVRINWGLNENWRKSK